MAFLQFETLPALKPASPARSLPPPQFQVEEEGERDQVPMGNVETVRTSSSRREVGPVNRPKRIGCMSGVFHFLSRHHNRSRKRITSGSRILPTHLFSALGLFFWLLDRVIRRYAAVKREVNPAAAPMRRLTSPEAAVEDAKKMRRSSETPRIPVKPREIRRKKPPAASPDSPRTSPGLVARLMGLDDTPPPAVAANERRELLRALEKCDEDLQALTRIIEAIRSAEIQTDTVVSTSGKTTERLLEIETNCGDAKSECNGEQPSPVSVLDTSSSPRNRPRSKRSPDDSQGIPADESRRNMILKPSRIAVLYTEDINTKKKKAHEATLCRIVMEPMPSGDQARAEDSGGQRSWWRARRRRSESRTIGESVEVGWEGAGAGEERWELGQVEAQLVGDLVEELVVELLGKLSTPTSCRLRIRF